MYSSLVGKIIETEDKWDTAGFHKKNNVYTFLNPVSYLDALNHKELFNQFEGIFADGSILVTAIKLIYGKTVKRWSFDMTSMARVLLEYAQKNRKSWSDMVVFI